MQRRDDEDGNPIQFFGGWFKGFWPEDQAEESIGHAIYREMVTELGLALREVWFLPFPLNDYTLERSDNSDSIVYIVKANIDPVWIGNKQRIQPGQEVQGQLNLREGESMEVYPLDFSLFDQPLYGNDMRMFDLYMANRKVIEQASFKLALPTLDQFPEHQRQELEDLITVEAD